MDKSLLMHKTVIMNKMSKENNRRRILLKAGIIVATVGGINLLSSCKSKEKSEGEGQEVSPPEDLMQEHGLLNRILLIYDNSITRLSNKQSFPVEAITNAAAIIRSFVEDYHEKQEENYLFPRFENANQLVDLVQTLRQQHQAGRNLTDQITQLSKQATRTDKETERLIQLLNSFNRMYRPHEAREDTVLFPAFRKLVSKNEYDSLGEEFENNEHRLFGEGGFETMVDKVAAIEKSLGIYELAQFMPQV
jgi:Uncharacterized conserved protein